MKLESISKSNQPFVSIIIPLYVICERFFRDLLRFEDLNYSNFEILIVCDQKVSFSKIKNSKLILTGLTNTGPAEKRDIALGFAKGEICAFIDDDAYPDQNWLRVATQHFLNPKIVAVGGPGVTPPEDNYQEQLTGLVYESIYCSGLAQNRFISLSNKFVDDWPAYNLLVRADILKEVGGYGVHYYGGEDTFLCMKLLKHGKIQYEGQAIVFHHRRKLFFDLLKQVANVGVHRGYFFKKHPETSRKWFYPIPSLLTISLLVFSVISLIKPRLLPVLLISLSFFILLGASSALRKTQWYTSILVGIGIIMVHVSYGVYFVKGLLTKYLKR